MTIGQVAGVGTPVAWNAASQITGLEKSNNAYAYTDRYNVGRSYTANGLNQYTLAGAVSHAYDAHGNLTTSGTSSYTYSKFNELKTGPNSTSLTYDGLGRLVQYDAPGTTRFSYAGPMMLAEHSSANAILRRYVPGPGALAGGHEIVVWYEGAGTADKRWLLGDERGSVVAVADASGAAIAVNRYDEYGIPATGNLGRFQYTGQAWLPELGLYNYKARMYSATLGRFMQTDPIGYGDGLNWYAYVGNDPVNRVDPSGLADEIVVTGQKAKGGFGCSSWLHTNDTCFIFVKDYLEGLASQSTLWNWWGGSGGTASAAPKRRPQSLKIDKSCLESDS